MNGIETQASIAIDAERARSRASAKKAGLSQPRWRASVAAGPKRYSIIDLPIIQLTATGLSMNGSRKTTRKNLRAADLGVEQQRQAEGDRVLDEHRQHVEDHVARARSRRTGRGTAREDCRGR